MFVGHDDRLCAPQPVGQAVRACTLGSAGRPLTAKFLVRRLSANLITLTRIGRGPGIIPATCRTWSRSALHGGEGSAANASFGASPNATHRPSSNTDTFKGFLMIEDDPSGLQRCL